MAMRPRTPTFGTHTPVRSGYETFHPKSEMKENEEAYFLHVYLPEGFIKERIQINFVAASRSLRIAGERPIIGGKKVSRFDQSYHVPENIVVEKLEAKFEHGTLIVTMPKKLTPQIVTTKEKVDAVIPRTPKATLSSKPTPTRVEEPLISDTKNPSPSTLGKGLNDLKKLKGTQKDNSRHPNIEDENSVVKAKEIIGTSAATTTPRGKTGNNNNKAQKGQEVIKPKLKLIMDDDEKIQEEIRQKALIEKVKRQLHEKDHHDEKESVTKKEVEEEEEEKGRVTYESRKVDQKYVDHNTFLEGKEIKARKESSILKAIEKGKETSNIDKARKNMENEMYTKGKGIKEVAASASQVVKRIREGKFSEKEKPLVANMCAAILVIVGLGAYVTYKFTSSSRT